MGTAFRSARGPACAFPAGEAGEEYAVRRVAAAIGSATFVLTYGGRPVASTCSRYARGGVPSPLPALQAFAGDLHGGFAEAMVVEASDTLVDPAPIDPAIAMVHLFKAHMLTCALQEAEWLVAAVPDTRIGFHRRVFRMQILSGAEHVPGLASPRVLMGLRYREQAPLLMRGLPLLAFDRTEERRFAATGEVRFHEATPAAAIATEGD
jgi:hypothetical protein